MAPSSYAVCRFPCSWSGPDGTPPPLPLIDPIPRARALSPARHRLGAHGHLPRGRSDGSARRSGATLHHPPHAGTASRETRTHRTAPPTTPPPGSGAAIGQARRRPAHSRPTHRRDAPTMLTPKIRTWNRRYPGECSAHLPSSPAPAHSFLAPAQPCPGTGSSGLQTIDSPARVRGARRLENTWLRLHSHPHG